MDYKCQDRSLDGGSFFKLLFNEESLLPKDTADMQLSQAGLFHHLRQWSLTLLSRYKCHDNQRSVKANY